MPIAAASASQLLQHSSRKRRPASPLTRRRYRLRIRRFAALSQTTTGFAHYAEYGAMEGRTESEYRLFVSGDLRIFH